MMDTHGLGFMVLCMVAAGFASTMNNWADSWKDLSWSINDVYMIGLMTGWMIFFMGVFGQNMSRVLIGIAVVGVSLICIRTQLFVSETQFLRGMIPHHSMAVFMSKRLAERPNTIPGFLTGIIETQSGEIEFMKQRLT
jgi:hypothetical protein